jgi:uncharacterized protein (DUF2267 family)
MIIRAYDDMQDLERFDRRDDGRSQNAVNYIPIGRRKPQRRQNQPLNFERYAQEANHFINEVAEELQTKNRAKAARITRAVLHAVRDRLIPDEGVQFGQALPMALKGVYFDQYDISRTPVKIRHPYDFLNYIRSKDSMADLEDFPSPEYTEFALQAVFIVLEKHLDPGHINKVKTLLPDVIVDMIGY